MEDGSFQYLVPGQSSDTIDLYLPHNLNSEMKTF